MGILYADTAKCEVPLKHFQVRLTEFVSVAPVGFVHDLSYTNDFSIKVANGHADQGMCSVASFDINLTVESRILR